MEIKLEILHKNFVLFGTNAKAWTRKCALLLPEIEKYRIWDKKGFGSIFEYAAKLAGMRRNSVEDALRILHKIEDKPALMKVVELKGLNAVRPVVKIATTETADFWAEKAQTMSKNTLEMYVREIRTSTEIEQENKTITMQLAPEVAQQLQKLKGSGDWNQLMQELLTLRAEKIAAEKPAAVMATSRHIPKKIQKHVLARTNGICSFPGCSKPYEILHHTQRFVLEKTHDPSRIEPLCKAHERIAHHGLIKNEDSPAGGWRLQKFPDKKSPKYLVDSIVAKFRQPTRPLWSPR